MQTLWRMANQNKRLKLWSTLQALFTKYACTSIGYNDWNTSNGAAEKKFYAH